MWDQDLPTRSGSSVPEGGRQRSRTSSPRSSSPPRAARAGVPPRPARLARRPASRRARGGAFPKLVVSGGHSAGFDAICDDLAERIGASRAVVEGAGHEIQFTGHRSTRSCSPSGGRDALTAACVWRQPRIRCQASSVKYSGPRYLRTDHDRKQSQRHHQGRPRSGRTWQAAGLGRRAELAEDRGLHLGGEPQPAHPLAALLHVGREGGGRPVLRRPQDLADDAHVAERDRQPLAGDRVVPAGGIADQDHASRTGQSTHASSLAYVAHGLTGVAVGEGRRPRHAVEPEGVDERLRAVRPGEPARLVEPEPEVQADPPGTLREREEVDVALGADACRSSGQPSAPSTSTPENRWCGGSLSSSNPSAGAPPSCARRRRRAAARRPCAPAASVHVTVGRASSDT